MQYQLNSDFILQNQFWCHDTCLIIGNNTTTHFLNPKILQKHITIGYNDIIHFGIIPNIYIISNRKIMSQYVYQFLKTATLFVMTPEIYQEFKKYLYPLWKEKRIYIFNSKKKVTLSEIQQQFYKQNPKNTLNIVSHSIFEYAIPLASFLGFKNIDLISCDYVNIPFPKYKIMFDILGDVCNYNYLTAPKETISKLVDYCNSRFQITDYSLYPNVGFRTQKYLLQYPEIIDSEKMQQLRNQWKNDIYSQYLQTQKQQISYLHTYYRDLKNVGIINKLKLHKINSTLQQQQQHIHHEDTYNNSLNLLGI